MQEQIIAGLLDGLIEAMEDTDKWASGNRFRQSDGIQEREYSLLAMVEALRLLEDAIRGRRLTTGEIEAIERIIALTRWHKIERKFSV